MQDVAPFIVLNLPLATRRLVARKYLKQLSINDINFYRFREMDITLSDRVNGMAHSDTIRLSDGCDFRMEDRLTEFGHSRRIVLRKNGRFAGNVIDYISLSSTC